MPIDIKMPALSPTMEEGTVAKWLVKPGDRIAAGDLLAEIETDKATMEMEAADEGTLLQILVPEGSEGIAVGTVIARLGDAGEAVIGETPAAEAAPATEAAPAAALPLDQVENDGIAGPLPEATASKAVAPPAAPINTSVKATPLARRLAAAMGIDLATVRGTGSGGRITRADLGLPAPAATAAPEAAASAPRAAAALAPVGPLADVPHEAVKLSSMRRTIARRLTESKQTVPHFYLASDCRLDALIALRKELNGSLGADAPKLSINDFIIKALAAALAEVPDANVQFDGDQLYRYQRVDVAVAVAIPGGLVTPVLKNVGSKAVSAIGREMRVLAEKARDGRLMPEDYQGGTVSLSNLGMFGISEMIPVINPPQAMILGVGAGEEKLRPVNGQPAVVTILRATASFDHRAIDGAAAAAFMQAFRNLIERPLSFIA